MRTGEAQSLIGEYVIAHQTRGRGHRASQPCKLVSVNARKGTVVVRPKNNHGQDETFPLSLIKRWIKGDHQARELRLTRKRAQSG